MLSTPLGWTQLPSVERVDATSFTVPYSGTLADYLDDNPFLRIERVAEGDASKLNGFRVTGTSVADGKITATIDGRSNPLGSGAGALYVDGWSTELGAPYAGTLLTGDTVPDASDYADGWKIEGPSGEKFVSYEDVDENQRWVGLTPYTVSLSPDRGNAATYGNGDVIYAANSPPFDGPALIIDGKLSYWYDSAITASNEWRLIIALQPFGAILNTDYNVGLAAYSTADQVHEVQIDAGYLGKYLDLDTAVPSGQWSRCQFYGVERGTPANIRAGASLEFRKVLE